MPAPDLLHVTLTAFVAVFVLLGLLSVLMTLITKLFPITRPRVTAVEVAAITTAAGVLLPGATVTRIEEIR